MACDVSPVAMFLSLDLFLGWVGVGVGGVVIRKRRVEHFHHQEDCLSETYRQQKFLPDKGLGIGISFWWRRRANHCMLSEMRCTSIQSQRGCTKVADIILVGRAYQRPSPPPEMHFSG